MHGNEFITEAVSVTLPEAPVPHVGDYIDYTPDTVETPYTLYGKYSGYGTYTSHVLTTPKDQEIPQQDTLKWRILKIYEDGSMDIIGNPTSKAVYFQGSLGYNNGVYLLHDMCKYLYSKPSQGIYARSVTLEDYEREMTEAGVAARDAYTTNGVQYGHAKTYKGNYSYYPNLYARENGSGIGVEIESTDTEEQIAEKLKQDGINVSNEYYTSPAEETYSPGTTTADSRLTITQTYYTMSINEANYGKAYKALSNSTYSWLASRYVHCNSSSDAYFGLCNASTGFYSNYLFYSSRGESSYSRSLRPVVTLPSSVKLELTEAGKTNSATYPHKIIKY